MAGDAACQLLQGQIAEGNGRMRMYSCQQLVSLCLIVLMKVKCVTVVMLAVQDGKHSVVSVIY